MKNPRQTKENKKRIDKKVAETTRSSCPERRCPDGVCAVSWKPRRSVA